MTKRIISMALILTTLFTIVSLSFTAHAATTMTLSKSDNEYSSTAYSFISNQPVNKGIKTRVTDILNLSVSANKYSGTTDDSFNFYATTSIPATRVTLKFNNNSTTYSMNSSDKKNWSLCGNHLSAGNRTVTITASSSNGQTVTKNLSVTVKQATTVFLQTDSRWANVPYGYKDNACTQPATISSSGCGLLSITNAVYYLTGKFIAPVDLAKLSLNNGYRVNGEGTAWAFAEFAAKTYGNSCGFKFVKESYSDSELIAHLKSGGVSVAVVPYHFVAMVAYDVSSDKILVLDSAPGLNNRPYTSATWIKSSELKSGCFQTYHYSFFSSATSNSPITIVPTALTLSVSANKYSGTTDDSFDFYATTNFFASKVTLKFNNNSTTYSMSSTNKKNWSLCGNHLSAGNRTITITAYSSNGQTVTKTLNINVTEIAYPSKDITVNYKYYKDVPSNHWAHKYVCAASYYGLMQGVGNDEFYPNSPIKYAHFISVLNKIHYVGSINNYNSISRNDAVVWLWQAAGCPSAPMNLLDNKTDVNLLIDTDSKYAWSWCMQNNIVNGYEDGTLRPSNTISRAEAAAIFVRYYCLEKEGFRVNNIYVV